MTQTLTILDERVPGPVSAAADDRLTLPFERRRIARQRAVLASGREIGIVMPRGTVLRGGDLLRGRDGITVAVVAAPEDVATVRCADPRRLARIAYHLGNRHVELEVGDGWVRYARDHVLDDMVRHLGGEPVHESAPFEPEGGAYAGGHNHGGGHRHDDGHRQEGGHRRHGGHERDDAHRRNAEHRRDDPHDPGNRARRAP